MIIEPTEKTLLARRNIEHLRTGKRECPRCAETKSLDEFYNWSGKLSSYCKDCYRKNYVQNKPDRRIAPLSISSETAAYVAGLIDGEGCVSLVKVKHKSVRGHALRAHIAIAICDTFLVELAQEIGVGRYYLRGGNRNPKWKPIYVWHLGPNACRALLPVIIPHLRLKKRQGQLLLRYLRIARLKNNRSGVEPRRLVLQEAIYQRIKELNRRGA